MRKPIVRKRICKNCASWTTETGVCRNPVSPYAYDETGECDTCKLFENIDCVACESDCANCHIHVAKLPAAMG